MKTLITLILWLALQAVAYSAEVTDTNASEEAQYEQLYQRFLTRMREVQSNTPSSSISFTNNLDTPQAREAFRRMFVVHPSFGLGWSEVPPPTVTSPNAMKGVEEFVATNGWHMCTNFRRFVLSADEPRPIRGLPWEVIRDREFGAITSNGILYIVFGSFGFSKWGVAYNPKTNAFPGLEFKHVGQHWYTWIVPDDGNLRVQHYEGDEVTAQLTNQMQRTRR
jgi:hypothetical protein